jgi:hypothetical protein
MTCSTADGSSSCVSKAARSNVNTTLAPPRLDANSTCNDNSQRYQSWQISDWLRQYEMDPNSTWPGSSTSPSLKDSGPAFTLSNEANTDVFSCSPSSRQNSTFAATCVSKTTGSQTSTASFQFDTSTDLMTITQSWACGGT